MSRLEQLLASVPLLATLAAGGWLALHHYGQERYQAGYDAAVDAGKELRDSEAAAALAIESGLRARLLDQDTTAFKKEQEYASNLEAAQRRVRAGVDSLRCPASPVQSAAAAGDRPAAAGPTSDGPGAELVPDAAAALLGDGATVAGIVRKFERLEQRFEECRAVNAK